MTLYAASTSVRISWLHFPDPFGSCPLKAIRVAIPCVHTFSANGRRHHPAEYPKHDALCLFPASELAVQTV